MIFSQNSAPLLIVMGQSNAHAHATKLPDNEVIREPLKNIHGLSREFNQAYGLSDIMWSGFTTGGMNLGENQDDTCSLANYFATMWQKAIDGGAALPDLYVIQISVGAQGIAPFEVNGWNMWYPLREPVLKPGKLGECNISLYPLATEILSLAVMNLISSGKKPEVIGLHWNQWECEARTGSKALNEAEENYRNLFWGFHTALGSDKKGRGIPLYLYRPLSKNYEPDRIENINAIFDRFRDEYAMCKILDLRESTLYDSTQLDAATLGVPNNQGIFLSDGVHYKPEAHRWFAQRQWEDLFG